jgi:hypothetical protein
MIAPRGPSCSRTSPRPDPHRRTLAPRLQAVVLLAAQVWMASWTAPSAALELLLVSRDSSHPPAPWTFAGLPHQTKPATRFDVVEFDGVRALRVDADRSFGNLVYPLPAGTHAGTLVWRSRIERPTLGADITQRSGEDMALRVCASFEMPMARVPYVERQLLRLAQAASDVRLPTALLCYVADDTLPVGTLVVSPFTRRMRSIVVAHADTGQWVSEQHDLGADFLRVFGDESASVPALGAIVVGADADNTQSHSVAYLSALQLLSPP